MKCTLRARPGAAIWVAVELKKAGSPRSWHSTEIHLVLQNSINPGKKKQIPIQIVTPDGSGSKSFQPSYTLATNRAGRISVGMSAVKVQWEAHKCYMHFSYRQKRTIGTKRPASNAKREFAGCQTLLTTMPECTRRSRSKRGGPLGGQ
jgi:hypothetical protein